MADPPPVPEPEPTPPRDDLRSLKRWLVVTAIWAVAASAIGLIALLSANDTDEQQKASKEVTRIERDLNARIDSLEQDINELAPREDVTRLEQRVGRAEDQAAKAAKDAKSANGDIDDANNRIDDLESRVEDLEAADTGGGDGDGANSP